MMGDEAQLETRASLLIRLRREPADQRAWDEFAERYGRLIRAWCQQWGLQAADADDVTQNVLLKLAQHLRVFRYDPSLRFRGYLRTTAQNACKDYLAGRRRAVAAGADSAADAVLESAPAREDLAARLEAAFDLEQLEIAQGRVRGRVEPHTWEAFRLTAIEGLSGADASTRLGIRVGTVFKAKSKVQQMLREELRRLEKEEPLWIAVPAAPDSRTS